METNTTAASASAHEVARSNRREVRNPILALPGAKKLDLLPDAARAALREVLLDIRKDARERAEKCWRTHKAPMAAYYKAIAVYAGHIARLLGPRRVDALCAADQVKTIELEAA